MRKTNEIALHCTACGGQLIERENRQNGGRFLGCSNYPQCAHTAPIPAFVYQVRAGAAPPPGMEDIHDPHR